MKVLPLTRMLAPRSPIAQSFGAKPTTPPQATETRQSYKCIVEYNSTPFWVQWSGSPEYPDLASFSPTSKSDLKITHISLDPELQLIWRLSTLHDYGTHASIRITDDDAFPILKLAHPDDSLSNHLIKQEFDVLSRLERLGVPTVDFDSQPIACCGVTCGYRMKALTKLEPGELYSRWGEVEDAVDQLHAAGFCHGDLNPSNVMKDEGGQLVLIDLSFAGQIGSPVPPFVPAWRFPTGKYCEEVDRMALKTSYCQSREGLGTIPQGG